MHFTVECHLSIATSAVYILSPSILPSYIASSYLGGSHFLEVLLCFTVNPEFLEVITFWHFSLLILVGGDVNSLPCWERILPGSLVFLHDLQAEILTPLVSDCLCKDICTVSNLVSIDSISSRAEGRLAYCLGRRNSVFLQSKDQACLLPVMKDLASRNLGFLSHNTVCCVCRYHQGLCAWLGDWRL